MSSKISFMIGTTMFVASVSLSTVFATTPSSVKGEQMLEDMINAESARVAELNVKLDPKLGMIHTLQRHSVGNDVKLLQQFLKVYGVYPEGLITGYFGTLTEHAVKKFQEKESIDSVGIAGPKTRARIIEISRQKTRKNPTLSLHASSVFISASATSSYASPSATLSASATPMVVVKNAAPEITDAVLSTDIALDGAAIAPGTSFASTTQTMYGVISLNNVAQDTKIAYIRYYGNTYVDSEISHPSRSNLRYFHFQWSLKPGSNRLVGNYSLAFYLNDKSVKKIQYTIY